MQPFRLANEPRVSRSAAVPRRLGFRHTGTLRADKPMADGTLRDTMVWTLERVAWLLG